MYYPDEIIEEVRTKNDIVDVIGSYVKIQKRAVHTLDFVRFIMKRVRLFLYPGISRFIIALAAEQAVMSSVLL